MTLSPATLHILVALAGEDRHGYGIMLEVKRQSEGQFKLGPGTLYDNLQKLMERGMVEETKAPSQNEDPRRRYYRLTRLGRSALSAEIARLENVVRRAKVQLRPAPGRSS
ncbi:MAG TPA: PadR family transcriptional regulator [Bryobacteraceae bacterium]|jgi:DNA-binding PadR family transcriptional regulator|nr:PadR family transcriptional regulator [Bryobacteraceae bacterium]